MRIFHRQFAQAHLRQGNEFRVTGLGYGIQDLGFKVKGLTFRVTD
jgi:hypothetical protein